MRVIHWYPGYLGGGGVANAVGALAGAQTALGVAVTVVTRDFSGAPLATPPALPAGASLVRWRPRACAGPLQSALPGWLPKAAGALRALAPDLVHVHGEFHAEHLYVPRLWPDVPRVISPHGGFHPEVLARSHRQLKRAYLAYARRTLYGEAILHALSPQERVQLERLFPGHEVACIHNGPGHAVRTVIAPDTGMPGTGFRFIYVGRLNVIEKGLDLALAGLAAARRVTGVDACLVLVGPDWAGGRAWLEREATRLGVRAHVHFTGAVDPSRVAGLIAAADCYVQPARNDGFGLAVAEALLVGKPVVISPVVGAAGYPELTAHPHLRVVALTSEAVGIGMTEVLRRRDELAWMARERLPAVREFLSWRTVASRHLERYHALLATRRLATVPDLGLPAPAGLRSAS